MSAHQNHHVSQAPAAASPLARWLRDRAPMGTLFSLYTDDAIRTLGYKSNQVFIAMLRELQDLRVIRYEAEKGRGARLTIRVPC